LTEHRESWIFSRFPTLFTSSKKPGVGIVNRKRFIDTAMRDVKFMFSSEKKLRKLAKDVFKSMGITDDKDHWVKPRVPYDVVISTENATPVLAFELVRRYVLSVING